MPTEALIRVENLTRYYSGTCAVNDVSFELARGEVLGFLGPNGAGKSTTMQIISGNLAPSAGKISINGIDLLDQPKAAKAEIGYLPEQPPVYRELSVDEYLDYCARLNRIPRKHRSRAIDTARERCGLGEVRSRLIGNLSKGYQQRVGIAQAIIHTPSLVILDEPTVGLDPIQIREIRGLIRELGEDHGIILSTHILPEVQATCNRVQIIHQGKLVFSDSTKALEKDMNVTAFTVRFQQAPDITVLQQIAGADRVEALADGCFRIQYSARNPVDELLEQAVNKHWRLSELTPERHTLEQIFIELPCSEAHVATNDEAA
jgi:ABC-2 type transport system ATP-binding protein